MSTTSSSNVVDGEIEAAFAAGAMPPEWRRLLLASGLNGNDVNVIAASIANTHLIILRTTWSSTQKMAFIALGVMGVLFLCLVVVVVFRETMGLMVTLLAVGVFYVAMALVAVMSISRNNNIDAEIDAAFAAGKMPLEWLPRLQAAGMNDSDVSVTAGAISETHRVAGDTWWSNENVPFELFGLFGTLFMFALAIVYRGTKGLMLTLLAWGLVILVETSVLAVIDACERRRARLTRDVARKVLENFLLSPPV
ncbi:hypothetical protein OsI_32295 [Oryza sativa Indica Group]|nr:hypothetical protein OsI_32295 [Oryza sativa Indica Group]